MSEFDNISSYFELLNSPECSNEERQQVQNRLLSIQRDPDNWPFIPVWLSQSASLQIQFFAAQCLLVRINRDWEALEEEEQLQLRQLIGSMLAPGSTVGSAARRKLEEAMVRVMERAFVSGWWKDPLGDLLLANDLSLLSLVPSSVSASSSSDPSKSYSWQHEIKSHSKPVIEALLKHLHSPSSDSNLPLILDCIKNWTSFGAFSFAQTEQLLPILSAKLTECEDCDEIEAIVDCLVEIGELVTRDAAEEARKARHFLPVCFLLASRSTDLDLDPSIITKITATVTEECASFLVQTCHDPQIQQFLSLLLKLTAAEGLLGVDDCTSNQTLNAWYLLTEAIDTDMDSQIPESNLNILVALLGTSLVPILLQKSTLPAPQIWSNLQRDLQQQFMQLRREFLDTLLYIQRALKTLRHPHLILQIIQADMLRSKEKTLIEVRLRALMIIAEEFADHHDESAWSPEWQAISSLIFTSPEITKDAINAKLAISLIGSLLPLMNGSSAANEAVKMLLDQLQGNPLVREECLGALQQAADAEVPLIANPQIIADLLSFLTSQTDSDLRSKMIKLLSRLITDLSDESQRWQAFNTLIRSCTCTDELSLVLKAPFTYSESVLSLSRDSPYCSTLALLKVTFAVASAEALLAAWLALSGSPHFPIFEGNSDPWPLLQTYLSSRDEAFIVLGAKLLAAWVYGMAQANSAACLHLLESANALIIGTSTPPEDALEAILDTWIHFLKNAHKNNDRSCLNSSVSLFNWTLQTISHGQMSIPLLRSLARFLCVLIEFPDFLQAQQLSDILSTILAVGISGKIGRSGMEILARVAHDISLQHAAFFPQALASIVNSNSIVGNAADKRTFLMNLGAAHTIKKFKTVLVEFCLQSRGIQ